MHRGVICVNYTDVPFRGARDRAALAPSAGSGDGAAVGRTRQEQGGKPGGWLRRLFAWRVDRQGSARVPLAASPDAMLREGPTLADAARGEGRPGEAMAGMYCARCGRP